MKHKQPFNFPLFSADLLILICLLQRDLEISVYFPGILVILPVVLHADII